MKTTLLTPETDENAVKTAAELIRAGEVVGMPTETVYGLAANALNGEAVKKIFLAKGRPQDNPLIVHIADFDQIYDLCPAVPPQAKLLADAFWPGPLTMKCRWLGAVFAQFSAENVFGTPIPRSK